MSDNSQAAIAEHIARFKSGVLSVENSVQKIVTTLTAYQAEFQRLVLYGAVAELEQFRILESHIAAGTLTEEVAGNLLQSVQQVRAEAIEKLAPVAKRLQALLQSPVESAAKTQTTGNES